jgi:hypothetical protein
MRVSIAAMRSPSWRSSVFQAGRLFRAERLETGAKLFDRLRGGGERNVVAAFIARLYRDRAAQLDIVNPLHVHLARLRERCASRRARNEDRDAPDTAEGIAVHGRHSRS